MAVYASSTIIIGAETACCVLLHAALVKGGGLEWLFPSSLIAKLADTDQKIIDAKARTESADSATVASDRNDADIKKYTNNATRKCADEKRHLTAQDVVVTLSSSLLFVCYLRVLNDKDLNSSRHARLFSTSPMSTAALQFHIAVTLYETALYIFMGKDFLAYAHHVSKASVLPSSSKIFHAEPPRDTHSDP